MKQTRGSAILIAIFLVAAVGSVSFGIARLFMLDSSIATMYENSTVAYYAAESGIEEGLLRYRYDANQEVGANPTNMRIFNLDGNSGIGTAEVKNSASYVYNPAQRYYTLNDTYLTRWYGDGTIEANVNVLNESDLAEADYPEEYIIPRDEAIKIDISNVLSSDDLDLFIKFIEDNGADCAATTTPFVEAKMTGPTPASPNYQTKIAFVDLTKIPSGFNSKSYISDSPDATTKALGFDKIISNIRNKNNTAIFDDGQKELTLKPVGCGAKIGIRLDTDNSSSPLKLPSPYNTIKSTGYYGGITRTIEAKIDRQAGTVYDLFDFAVYRPS